MLILILATTALIAAFIIIRKLFSSVFRTNPEIFAAAIVFSNLFIAGAGSAGTLFLPTAWGGGIALFVLAAGGIVLLLKGKAGPMAEKNTPQENILILVLFLLLAFTGLQGFSTTPDGMWHFANKALVDIPYHLSQVIRISEMHQWDFEEPNFAGEFIRYPYFINFISGLLLKTGTSLTAAYYTPSLLLILAGVILLVALCRELKLNMALTLPVLAGTFFAGGLGYLAYLMYGQDFSVPLRGGMSWPFQNISNPGMVPGVLVWQRTFILGFPVFLAALLAFLRGIKNSHRTSLIVSAVLTGFLPFAHMHSFIAMGIVAVSACIFLFLLKDPQFFTVVRFFGYPALTLSIPQLFIWILAPQYPLFDSSAIRLGWMTEPGQTGGVVLNPFSSSVFLPWVSYMWSNFGPVAILPLSFIYGLKKNIFGKISGILAIGSLGLWLIPNLIRFQIWDFDNNKFLSYATILTILACGVWIAEAPAALRKKYIIVFWMIIAGSIPSSILATVSIIHNPGIQTLNTGPEQNAARWLRENTPENSVILSGLTLVIAQENQVMQEPVIINSGRRGTGAFVILLYTHGIDSYDRRQVIKAFFEEPAKNIETIKTIPADYLLFDDSLRQQYPKLEKELVRLKYPVVFIEGPLKIFRLSGN